MPGYELIGDEELNESIDVFNKGGILFRQGFENLRNNTYKVDEFERAFSNKLKTNYSLAVTSGTAALRVALAALDIKEGDEVITQSFTFVATVEAIIESKATPVCANIDKTLNLDPNDLKKLINKNTKAVIVVHMLGTPANLIEIKKICDRHKIVLIEDTAWGCGGFLNEKALGTWGDIGTFSFDFAKTITTGEGGMVISDNKNIYEKAKYLRDHAMSKEKRYWHTEIGYNYRMTNLQAALAYAQLTRVDEILEKRWDIYLRYESNLQDSRFFDFYKINKDSKSNGVNWLTSIIFKEEFLLYKEEVIEKLKQKGIDSRSFFYPMSKLPIHESYNKQNFKISEYLSKAGLSLPTYDDLSTKDIDIICSEIKGVFSGIFNS